VQSESSGKEMGGGSRFVDGGDVSCQAYGMLDGGMNKSL
jgi:hypothetical protein